MLFVNGWPEPDDPLDAPAFCSVTLFDAEKVFEAWEHMTYGGIQLDTSSRVLLDWIADVRFEPFGSNHWRVYAAR